MSAKSTKLTQWIQELMESETDGGIPYKAVIALVKEKKLTAKDLDAIHKELHDRHIRRQQPEPSRKWQVPIFDWWFRLLKNIQAEICRSWI